MKLRVKEHGSGSARGADVIPYAGILSIPNEELRTPFQTCVDSCDSDG